MSQQSCEDAFVHDDAPLQELGNLPPRSDAYYSWWKTQIERDYITKELKDIYSAIFDHFSTPNPKEFIILFDRLASHIDAGLHTAEHRKQISDILGMASSVFELFVMPALELQRLRHPSGDHPTHGFILQYLEDLVDCCLQAPYADEMSPMVHRLKSELESNDVVQIRSISEADINNAIRDSGIDRKWSDETEEDVDDPDEAPDVVAQGSSAPSIVHDHSIPLSTTTTEEARSFYAVLDTQRLPAKSRLFTASRSFNVLPTSEPRTKEGLSRTKSLSAMPPLKAQRQVLAALGMVTEEEE